jgi:hypothetical protein
MTGFNSKRKAAQDKLEQWDNEAFNAWWDSDYDDSANPYEKDTFAYWAWAGWQAALAQTAQEPVCPKCKVGVLYECVACSSNNYPPAAQRQWVSLTDEEMYLNCPNWVSQEQCKVWIQQIEAKLKEKNT